MSRFDNPFHDLWVTENLDASAFVRMFSDVLIHDAEALFSTGNIVLKGRQGSGKSMLLTLLESATRIAYAKSNVNYPVPSKQCCFISAGIHLTQQSASLIASRANEYVPARRAQIVASNFADYFNALLCRDLLENILLINSAQNDSLEVLSEVKISLSKNELHGFFDNLTKKQAWRGVLRHPCASLEDCIGELNERVRMHRLHANGMVEELPNWLLESRYDAGIPVAELASALRESGIIPSHVLVLLRVDQHEELYELERHSGLGSVFRQVLNSALARRDSRVAYRIGTRHYAWDSDLSSWGSGAPLEQERDYSVIDLDFILRREEHSRGWKFPVLAHDVLSRRLTAAGLSFDGDPLRELFGRPLSAKQKAKKYVGDTQPSIKSDSTWAIEWLNYLEELWRVGDPLDARFGEAWLRQRAQVGAKVAQHGSLAQGLPWRRSKWWAKERNEIALLQLAGERQQALIWSGDRQVIDLAGNNILAFMTICKTIWATWQRRNADDAKKDSLRIPNFSIDDQIVGINEASHIWFKKLHVGLEADRRNKFISALGSWFRSRMLSDRRLAYPGHNGFSLEASVLMLDNDLIQLIKLCRDHGDLIEVLHTTKNKSQERRLKWYLHPLLCPYFRIPHVRTKEPIYSSLNELEKISEHDFKAEGVNIEILEQESSQLGLPGFE
ncbi:hypothetical protein SDC9_59205 [bioreactor metagenome]|uniref:Uncharacterized protein n=1 Tax=bioreactor metagenome TaxID=1076179 RepID=A0A644XAS8_9ZZZZ